MARWYEDLTQPVGRTPPARLRSIGTATGAPAPGRLASFTRGGRVRDRTGAAPIEGAEGRIGPGTISAEPAGGSTGISVAPVLFEA